MAFCSAESLRNHRHKLATRYQRERPLLNAIVCAFMRARSRIFIDDFIQNNVEGRCFGRRGQRPKRRLLIQPEENEVVSFETTESVFLLLS